MDLMCKSVITEATGNDISREKTDMFKTKSLEEETGGETEAGKQHEITGGLRVPELKI